MFGLVNTLVTQDTAQAAVKEEGISAPIAVLAWLGALPLLSPTPAECLASAEPAAGLVLGEECLLLRMLLH